MLRPSRILLTIAVGMAVNFIPGASFVQKMGYSMILGVVIGIAYRIIDAMDEPEDKDGDKRGE